jgi:DNA modification methylase
MEQIELKESIDDFLLKIKDEKLDLIITDPPYPFDNKNGSNRFSYIDGDDQMYKRLEWADLSNIFEKLLQQSNVGARLYVFTDRDGFAESKDKISATGWKYRNTLVWNKIRMGGVYHWRNSREYINYFSNGSRYVMVKNH